MRAELHQYGLHMAPYRRRRHAEPPGHRFRTETFDQERETFPLSGGEMPSEPVNVGDCDTFAARRPRHGVDDRLTLTDASNRFRQHGDSPGLVHESPSTVCHRLYDGVLVVLGAENDHLDARTCDAE